MNYWTDLSIKFANQRNYLDELFSVYPLAPDVIRHLDETTWKKVEAAFQTRNDQELLQNLLTLDLFPIKDSYVPYLRRDRTALPRNPETVKRICGRLYEMGLEKIWARSSEPKETNRQIGPLFRRWLNQNILGLPLLSELEFTATKDNAILRGSDAQLKQFAKDRLGYTGRKGLDFVARMHRNYVIGEAKFLTDFGGHPKRRFSEFPSEPACNQEYAGGPEQGLDDEAEPVVAQREAPVFEHPSIAALHRPAPLTEP
jgi:Tsp45I type II restriction enzyme